MKLITILKDFYFLQMDLKSMEEVLQHFNDSKFTKESNLKKIQDQIYSLEKILDNVINYIDTIKDPITRELLTERYINNKTWEQVSKRIGYTKTHTQRINKAIINKLENIEI